MVTVALTSQPSPLPAIFSKDLLATLHLLVALAKRFQPDLALPSNVQVEVITMEVRAGHGVSLCSVSILGPWRRALDWGCFTGRGRATRSVTSHQDRSGCWSGAASGRC